MSLLNPNLRGFYETDARNYVLYGGRGSSKTYHTAGFCVFLACNYRVKFLCVRQFQNKIADSVKTVIEEAIYKHGLADEFDITETSIDHKRTGSSFQFLGIQRNLKEIKGIAGIDILWIEEAEDLSDEQWKILEPTVRDEGSRIFIVFNPRLTTDFVYKRFVINPPPRTVARKINYDENPYASSTLMEIIEACKARDYDEYEHVYLGEPKQDDEAVIIKRSWVMAALEAAEKLKLAPQGMKRVGFDVADSGEDKCAMVYAHGSHVMWSDLWKAQEDELLKSCTRVWHAAKERNALIVYDSIGVGASAGAKFGELNAAQNHRLRYQKFNAGSQVYRPDAVYSTGTKNKDMFANIKAQAWWSLADRFRNTYNAVRNGQRYDEDDIICIDPQLPHLAQVIDELCTPLRDYDNNGRVKVESKKDLAKRDIASPNLADAFVMAFAPGQAPMNVSEDAVRLAYA